MNIIFSLQRHLPSFVLPAVLILFSTHLWGGQIETYTAKTGEVFFAVPLTASMPEQAVPVDAVIAVDLSAGQLSSQVRTEARRAAETFITGLAEGSRVRVFAASNRMTPIGATPEFLPASPELAAAVGADLAKETPLGAMDLKGAIRAAAKEFHTLGSARPKSIVFIGRGVSTVSFFDRYEAAALTEELLKDRITFSAFANGAVTNNNALASLVYQTGGYLVDLRIKDGADAGACLAESEKAVVYWLREDDLAAKLGVETLYPERLPPIRSDRETFLIGSGDLAPEAEFNLVLPAELADGTEAQLGTALTVGSSKEENRSLQRMVHDAAKDGGLALPIPGRALLREYQAALENQDEVIRQTESQSAKSDRSGESRKRNGTSTPENSSPRRE